jgi:hypothetical protein
MEMVFVGGGEYALISEKLGLNVKKCSLFGDL